MPKRYRSQFLDFYISVINTNMGNQQCKINDKQMREVIGQFVELEHQKKTEFMESKSVEGEDYELNSMNQVIFEKSYLKGEKKQEDRCDHWDQVEDVQKVEIFKEKIKIEEKKEEPVEKRQEKLQVLMEEKAQKKTQEKVMELKEQVLVDKEVKGNPQIIDSSIQNLTKEDQNQDNIKNSFSQPQVEQIPPSKLNEPTFITNFSDTLKSQTISLIPQIKLSTQQSKYYQNQKLILTEPLKSRRCSISFKIKNLKYCVGYGLALLQIMHKHNFDYKSYDNQLGHGLYMVTSQGYSWSHSDKSQDDIMRETFKKVKNQDVIHVMLNGNTLNFVWKEGQFQLAIPDAVIGKYQLCFCAYLHQKSDSIQIVE